MMRLGTTVTLFIAVLVGGVGALSSSAQAQPATASDFQFSPDAGSPGATIVLSGHCSFDGGPADRANVQLFRKIPLGSGKEPFDKFQNYEVQPDTSFSGELLVPDNAPPDDYGLRMTCVAGDQVFGDQEGPFTVEQGPTTTSISTTSSSSSEPPPGSAVGGFEDSPVALARTGPGRSTSASLLIGASLVCVGTVAVLLSRRRRAHS